MPAAPADTVFRHPAIRPLAYDTFAVQAVAVRQGRVAATGSIDELKDFIGPATEVVELDGEVVQPAFHDAHLHLLHLHGDGDVDVSGCVTPQALVAALARPVERARGDDQWVLARGIAAGEAASLLAAVADSLDTAKVPTLVRTHDGHAGWISEAGRARLEASDDELARALATALAEAPRAGRFRHAAEESFERLLDVIPGARRTATPAQLKARMRRVFAAGVATVHEAVITRSDLPVVKAWFREHPPEETGRMHGMLHAAPGAWEWIRERTPKFALFGGRLSLGAVKVFLDGTLSSQTAWMEADEPPPRMSLEELEAVSRFCLAEGFQLAVHALGRQAVRAALDVFERVRPAMPRPYHAFTPVWRLEHAEFIEPEDIQRAAALGIVLSLQPLHLAMDATMLLGRYRPFLHIAYPWTEFTDAGVALALGSDAPVADCAPLRNLAVACGPDRRALLGNNEAPLVLHALSRDVAIHAHTLGGAVAALRKLGGACLVDGEPADLVSIDGDPLRCPVEDLSRMAIDETVVAGRTAWSADADEG